MRRKDREMDNIFAKVVIDKSKFGVLSINNGGSPSPYSIPLSLVRDGDFLYFHSATEGQKLDLMRHNEHVKIVFVGDVHVPDMYSNELLEEMSQEKDKAGRFISSVFTTEYESAIVEGKVYEVLDEDEKVHALKLICEKYIPNKMSYFDYAVQAGLHRTRIFRIQIDSLTAKRKKYDKNGNEMKWGKL